MAPATEYAKISPKTPADNNVLYKANTKEDSTTSKNEAKVLQDHTEQIKPHCRSGGWFYCLSCLVRRPWHKVSTIQQLDPKDAFKCTGCSELHSTSEACDYCLAKPQNQTTFEEKVAEEAWCLGRSAAFLHSHPTLRSALIDRDRREYYVCNPCRPTSTLGNKPPHRQH
jgi:hypothetical protein